eukprot:GGOE01028055.1.p3 GENE.GGOE01028055.1~~GGOE01028055.1.p3  ORF type:complete len:135 (+),score=8.00 GGOE01028055.1:922-1326(+)
MIATAPNHRRHLSPCLQAWWSFLSGQMGSPGAQCEAVQTMRCCSPQHAHPLFVPPPVACQVRCNHFPFRRPFPIPPTFPDPCPFSLHMCVPLHTAVLRVRIAVVNLDPHVTAVCLLQVERTHRPLYIASPPDMG